MVAEKGTPWRSFFFFFLSPLPETFLPLITACRCRGARVVTSFALSLKRSSNFILFCEKLDGRAERACNYLPPPLRLPPKKFDLRIKFNKNTLQRYDFRYIESVISIRTQFRSCESIGSLGLRHSWSSLRLPFGHLSAILAIGSESALRGTYERTSESLTFPTTDRCVLSASQT